MKGFSMKLGGLAAQKKAERKPPCVNALFAKAMEDEDEAEATRKKKGLHPLVNCAQPSSKRLLDEQAKLAAEDPSVFQYDEVFESASSGSTARSSAPQMRQLEGLEQKKRVGLTMRGAPKVDQKSQYIEKLQKTTTKRLIESEIIEQRIYNRERAKEKDLYGDKETFVTSGYKEKLHEREAFLANQREKDRQDEERDAVKQQDGLGFAALHRTFLNASRGGQAGAEASAKEEPAASVKEEPAPAVKEEPSAAVKKEPSATVKDEPEGGVKREPAASVKEETSPPAKRAKAESTPEELHAQEAEAAKQKEAAKAARLDKAASAKERYLARKKGAGYAG